MWLAASVEEREKTTAPVLQTLRLRHEDHPPLFRCCACTAAFAAPVWAATVPGFDGNTLPTNDDESTDRVPLGFGINFLGESYDGVFVNNNGNVTFDESLFDFTPFDLTLHREGHHRPLLRRRRHPVRRRR